MALYPNNMLFTSESVTEGHPDKFCDQVADAILDECLTRDPSSRVACDAYVAMGSVVVGGEVTSRGDFSTGAVVRAVGNAIGYNSPAFGFDVNACTITRSTYQQSTEAGAALARSTTAGPGSQSVASGYACNHTPELMPLPILLANRLAMRLAEARKKEILPFLGPDGRTQVTVEYQGGKPVRVDSVAVAAQHTREVLTRDRQNMNEEARQGIVSRVIMPVLQPLVDRRTKIVINGAGRFLVGGPMQSGATGRKGACDTYGGWAPCSGATFSGKDPANVDRAAGYMARCMAKNVVAAGLADECLVQLPYCFGQADPISVMVTTFGTATRTLSDAALSALIKQVCPLSAKAIVDYLGLMDPIYRRTAAYGHFGRTDESFPWERTELADELLGRLVKA